MENIDLSEALLAHSKSQQRDREIGKYYVSNLWAMRKGFITPQNYLQPETPDYESVFKMWQGTWKHSQVQQLLTQLGYVHEERAETFGDGWTLSCRADSICYTRDHLLEIKTSSKMLTKAKPWHLHQARCYCSLFGIPEGFVVQPVIENDKIQLQVIGTVKRDDAWFQKELDFVQEFHKMLLVVGEREGMKIGTRSLA